MNIIFTTSLYPPEIGDPANYVKKIAQKLSKEKKHDIKVITYANEVEETKSFSVIKIKKRCFLFFRIFKFFFKLLKMSKNTDLIYSQNSIASTLPSILVKKIRKIPLILRFREDESWERSQYLKLSEKKLDSFLKNPIKNKKIRLIKYLQSYILSQSDLILSPSETTKKIIEKHYKINPEKIKVNYDPIKKEKILELENKKNEMSLISFSPPLNNLALEDIILSLNELQREFKNINLMIIGKNIETKIKSLIKQLNLENKIIFKENISQAEKEYLLKNSEILILNSEEEHNPNLIFQGFYFKIPIIATEINLHKEIIKDKINGILIPKNNSKKLLENIKLILNNKNLKEKLISQARNDLEKLYSWKNHLEILLKTFQKYEK